MWRSATSVAMAIISVVSSVVVTPYATAQQPDLIRIEISGLADETKGHVKFYQDQKEVKFGGFDSVKVEGGQGEVSSGSAVQVNFKGKCSKIVFHVRIRPESRDRIHIGCDRSVRVSVFVDSKLVVSDSVSGATTLLLSPP